MMRQQHPPIRNIKRRGKVVFKCIEIYNTLEKYSRNMDNPVFNEPIFNKYYTIYIYHIRMLILLYKYF